MHTHQFVYVFDPVLFLGIIGAVASLVGALIAGLVWIVYRNQLKTMRDALAETRASNEIARQTLVLGRRAWLVPTEVVDTPNRFEPAMKWKMTIILQNCGGVPATAVTSQVVAFLNPDLPDKIPVGSKAKTQGVPIVAPHHPRRICGSFDGLSSDAIKKVESGTLVLYLYWRSFYEDVLMEGAPRWSSACWQFDPESGRWAIAEKHNTLV